MKPTRGQMLVLKRLGAGGRLVPGEHRSDRFLIGADGDLLDKVFSGMFWRMTRDGWIKRGVLTDAGRSALGQPQAGEGEGQ